MSKNILFYFCSYCAAQESLWAVTTYILFPAAGEENQGAGGAAKAGACLLGAGVRQDGAAKEVPGGNAQVRDPNMYVCSNFVENVEHF